MNQKQCHGFTVYDVDSFYALSYANCEDAFKIDAEITKSVLKKFRNSTIAHFSNYISSKYKINTNESSAYGLMAKKYCPKVFNSCGLEL